MPDLALFEQEILSELSGPVDAYYDTVEASALPQTGLGGVFQPLLGRLAVNRAQAALRTELRNVLRTAYQVAGNLGNGGRVMDAAQHREVLRRIAQAENYLDGFLADLRDMSRAQALARIAKYMPPILTTASVIAVSDLPQLPILPNDPRLDCVTHAKGLPVCRCRLKVVRVGPADWDVFWELDPAGVEHCGSCQDLARSWNPLLIRRGKIVAEARAA